LGGQFFQRDNDAGLGVRDTCSDARLIVYHRNGDHRHALPKRFQSCIQARMDDTKSGAPKNVDLRRVLDHNGPGRHRAELFGVDIPANRKDIWRPGAADASTMVPNTPSDPFCQVPMEA
jgi:hypothetical protein